MHIQSVGIIGYGQFGVFIEMLVQTHFPTASVRIYSRSHEIDNNRFFSLESVSSCDLLFLCVPISAFKETVDTILPHLGPTTIVVDVATVKKHTVEVLRTAGVPRFIATHPMFGPYSYAKHNNSLADLRIALCESTLSPEEMNAVRAKLAAAGLRVLELSADDHDRLVAETLFLTHLVGQTVHQGGFERTAIDTVSFGFLMDAVESVAHDEALFKDVYTYNPHCDAVLKRFTDAHELVRTRLTK